MSNRKQTLIACSMMEDEIHQIFDCLNCSVPVVWIDRGFHNTPQKLKEELQKQIDLLQDYSSVTVFLQERDMEMYVYSYSPAEEYRYFCLNYSLRAYDGSIGFNFNEKGLDSYELSWNS